MGTFTIKQKDIKPNWHLVDASGKNLGRLASRVAFMLRGKHKPEFTPHMDMGDFVVVINAVVITTCRRFQVPGIWRPCSRMCPKWDYPTPQQHP